MGVGTTRYMQARYGLDFIVIVSVNRLFIDYSFQKLFKDIYFMKFKSNVICIMFNYLGRDMRN